MSNDRKLRTVDLTAYLPPFLREYAENGETLEAENPEFNVLWAAQNAVLDNCFAATADEYGISRFEKLLAITPKAGDTIEDRGGRVLQMLQIPLPLTFRYLEAWLKGVNAGNSVTVGDYSVLVLYHLEDAAMSADEMRAYLEKICPLNMNIVLSRIIEETAAARTAANITRLTKTLYIGMRE